MEKIIIGFRFVAFRSPDLSSCVRSRDYFTESNIKRERERKSNKESDTERLGKKEREGEGTINRRTQRE